MSMKKLNKINKKIVNQHINSHIEMINTANLAI